MDEGELWRAITQRLVEDERSQAWLARRLRLKPQRLNNYMQGIRRTPPDVLAQVMEFLGVEREMVA